MVRIQVHEITAMVRIQVHEITYLEHLIKVLTEVLYKVHVRNA